MGSSGGSFFAFFRSERNLAEGNPAFRQPTPGSLPVAALQIVASLLHRLYYLIEIDMLLKADC